MLAFCDPNKYITCGWSQAPFGIFCVFDGHGGFAAAEAASRFNYLPHLIFDLSTSLLIVSLCLCWID